MSGRLDYYFRQQVTEAELDRGFDLLEQADWDIVVDQGFTGVVLGLGVGENGPPDLNVQVGNGTAYSKDGERINIPAPQVVDLSQDDGSASTAVGAPGNEKWVSLFVVFDRVLSDPRIDGNSLTVFFERAESFTFSVVQGAEAASGLGVRPALDAGKILLCDTLLTFGQTTIVNAGIDTTRRENRLFPLASALYGGGANWADGTTNPATDVESQLDKIIDDLAQSPAGGDRILTAAIAGAPNSLVQASVANQIGQLLTALNAHENSGAEHLTLTAIRQLLSGGIIEAAAAKPVNEAFLLEARNVDSGDPGLIADLGSGVAGTRVRLYAGEVDFRNGFWITRNCFWNPTTNVWTSDDSGDCFAFGFGDVVNGINISHRVAAAGAETWAHSHAGWGGGAFGFFEKFNFDIDDGTRMFMTSPVGENTLIQMAPQGTQPGPGFNQVNGGALYRKNMVKAWARLSTDGLGAVTVEDGFRINDATTIITGSRIRFGLSPFLSNTDYVVIATPESNEAIHWAVDGKTTQTFDLHARTLSAATTVNPAVGILNVSVMVIGED